VEPEQLSIWPDAPHNGTATSREAARRIRNTVALQRSRVLAAIIKADDGATREEIEKVTGIAGNSVRPRVAELIAARLVKEKKNDVRATKSGRSAQILRPIHA
jgi:predicted transcriptional regulator